MSLASANEAMVRSDLNKKLSTMTTEEVQEFFRALRPMKEDSPMTDIVVYKKIKNDNSVGATTCWNRVALFQYQV